LVLRLFPQSALQPMVAQLETLFRNRDVLRTHLAEPGLHRRRASLFRVALLEFHTVDRDGGGEADWRADYTSSFLWGAFRGVPMAEQGSLRAALAAYAPAMRDRVRAGRSYFDSSARGNDSEESRYRLLRDCVLPLLGDSMPRAQAVGVLKELRRRAHPPANFLGRIQRRRERFVHWLTRGVTVQVTGDDGLPVVVVGRTILINDSLNDLIRRIDPDEATINRAAGDA
jgi:hypothetical protein